MENGFPAGVFSHRETYDLAREVIFLRDQLKRYQRAYHDLRIKECPGHGRGGKANKCCTRAGEYNGFGSDGPTAFTCPNNCSCHD